MKKISLNASIDQKSINYSRVTVLKIERDFPECGGRIVDRLYGRFYLPRAWDGSRRS